MVVVVVVVVGMVVVVVVVVDMAVKARFVLGVVLVRKASLSILLLSATA